MSSYSLRLGPEGGGPPILKVFVHQIVIFTVEAPPPEAKVGSAAVPCNSLTLFTLARVSEQAHTSKHCLGDDTREDRNRQAIKCITQLSNVHTLNDPKGEQKADTI